MRPQRQPRIVADDDLKIREFAGLVNAQSQKDFGMRALSIADNVVITDTKKIRTRPGCALLMSGTPADAFVGHGNLYVIENGDLKRVASPTDTHLILSGVAGADVASVDINGSTYFAIGSTSGILHNDTYHPLRIEAPSITSVVEAQAGGLPATPFRIGQQYTTAIYRFIATYELADGREGPPSDEFILQGSTNAHHFIATVSTNYLRTNIYCTEANGTVYRLASFAAGSVVTVFPNATGRELTTMACSSFPDDVSHLSYWQGRLHAAQYFGSEDTTVIWSSRPFAYHLYDASKDFIILPGQLSLMQWVRPQDVLLIGTTKAIYVYDGEKLVLLADYGVVPGTAGDADPTGTAYFWTTRGFCKALPFENLTEKYVGMPPGLRAATQLVYFEGMQQVVTITQGGGTPFNVRS